MSSRRGKLVYVGNLPQDIRERDIDDLFAKVGGVGVPLPAQPHHTHVNEQYGRIKYIDVKTPARPPAFAFVEFEDGRYASTAHSGSLAWINCTIIITATLRDAEDAVRGRDGYDFYGSRLRVEIARGPGGGGPPPAPANFRGRGTGYRVLVKGLPQSASWQDLKVPSRTVVDTAGARLLGVGRCHCCSMGAG